jgi:CelD/BcsL family acetyltransferase involved in cellulose biosynthesis
MAPSACLFGETSDSSCRLTWAILSGVQPRIAEYPFPAGLVGDARPFTDVRRTRREIVVQFLTGTHDFAQLAEQWDRLHAQSPTASVFNSWIWLYQWWQTYGGHRPLRLLVALEGGEAVGMLALYIQTVELMGRPVRLLRLVGTGGDTYPDDLGPVLVAERENEVARKLAEAALCIGDVDVLAISDIDPRSRFPSALEEAAADGGHARVVTACERIAYTDLAPTWEQFLKTLTSDRRTRIRSARRKAQAAHAMRFFVWDDAARLDRALDRLVELHRARWDAAGGSDSFASAQYVDFHRNVIKATFARGWLRLYCLELDGETAAITYCYRFRNRVYLMQAGFDPAKAKSNPGKVLLGYALEHAIGEGNQVFDFLRGEHRYKDQLATGHRTTLCVRVFRRTRSALAYRLMRIWLPLLKARLLLRPAPKLEI